MRAKRKREHAAGQQPRLSKARLDELVEEALVDAYGESEQVTGFYTMMENDLRLPFRTEILRMTVTVEGIDITEDDQLVAVCRKDRTKQRISLSELPLPPAASEGSRVDRCVSILANGQDSISTSLMGSITRLPRAVFLVHGGYDVLARCLSMITLRPDLR